MRWWDVMRGGGPDGAPVVSSGMAARGRNHDRAGGRDGAVVRGRIESREDLDRQDVDGGDLLEHLQVLDGYVIEDHTYLVVLIEARPPAPLDSSRLSPDFPELHVGNRQSHRVPRRLGAGLGDRIGRDEPRAARRVRILDPGPCAATARGAYEADPHERGDGPET